MDILDRHRETWDKKPLIRKIYAKWYKIIINSLSNVSGKTVEIGAGTGNLKEYKKDIIASDIVMKPWLDMAFDAHKMPFSKGELANIVMFDVLHHLADPLQFLNESYRVLAKGGRIVMLEPYPSVFSKVIYKKFHPEPFIFDIDYYINSEKAKDKDPWDSNQAIPYLLFFRDVAKFNELFKGKFIFKKRIQLSFLTYPLSGGFENKQLYPDWAYNFFELLELILIPLRKWIAFRCFVVIEKI